MNNGNFGLDRGGFVGHCYSLANALLMIVPGTALLVFGEGKTLILPAPVIDFVFPFALPLPERMLLVALTEKFKVFEEITFADVDRVDIFVRQFFVLSLLVSLLVLGILTLQSRAGYLFPAPEGRTALGFLKVMVILFVLREWQVYLILAKVPSGSQSARVEFMRMMLHVIAPELLIELGCGLGVVMWSAGLLIYREVSAR
jgi:hypothetical protein